MSSSCLSLFVAAALVTALGCGDDPPVTGPDTPGCSDLVDNDGDGMTDFPEDLGCDAAGDETEDSPAKPQCSDNRDNDGDGVGDFPNDPGCATPQSDSETDDCPAGPLCPQCSNDLDDDGNGAMDYPGDPGCESAGDALEFVENPAACGAALTIKDLPASGIASGTLDGTSVSGLTTTCGGGGGASGIAYRLILTEPKVVVASTDSIATLLDTVIDIRPADCTSASLACNDDFEGSPASELTISLAAGVYYIIVEGQNSSETGNYMLTVQLFAGEGTACTMQSDCGTGLVCRIPNGGTTLVCTQPVCADGFDDDSDTRTDFPDDPGCLSPSDDSEDDDCPSGPGCPACSNGIDDDGDTAIDYPLDSSCGAASGNSESCNAEQDPVLAITTATVSGTLIGASDDHAATCGSAGGVDVLYTINLPAMATLALDTEASAADTILTVLPATCAEPNLGCDDDGGISTGASALALANLPAGTYIIAVDGFSATALDTYNLNVGGTVAAGGSCESALFTAGVITCGAGFVCDGTAGARTCRSQCTDGIDNNNDGDTDFPNDAGCASPGDNTETTVCPGAACPACSDGADNDLDGQTDFPLDSSCVAAGGTSESCLQAEPITVITTAATTGTTVGATNDFEPTCASTSGPSGPDVALQIDVPAMQSLTLDLTTGYDSVHALLGASCAGTALACEDFTAMTVTNVAPGRYFLIVDGFFSTSEGSFTVATSGVIANGGSCETPLFTSGVFTCATGTVCDGTAGARTCRTQCSDGIDNNNDGDTDFPNDAGCTSLLDTTETTVCPGAGCPACSNTTDDDGDSSSDFPADFGCASAAGPTEVFCAAEADFTGLITAPTTTGTLAGVADNFVAQSCQSNTGNDVTYALVLPVPVAELVVDTFGSTIEDTILAIRDANCGAEFGCNDDSGGATDSLRSLLRLGNVSPGSYAITVDGFADTNNGAFQLHVRGTVAAGTACTSPLFAGGVLACPAGTTCTSGTCQ